MSAVCAERLTAVAVTPAGLRAALRLAETVGGLQVYAPRRLVAEGSTAPVRPFDRIDTLAAELMATATGIVFFLAAGAAVRLIAPYLRAKEADPGVVVVEETCRYAVSLLAGHVGGGNALARRVAACLGAVPVITTATDAADLPAPDLLGRAAGWRHKTPAKAVAAALLAGEPVGLYQDAGEPVAQLDGWPSPWPSGVRQHAALAEVTESAAIIVSDRVLPVNRPDGWLIIRPPSLHLGVGCERGVPEAEIARAVAEHLRAHGLAPGAVAMVATLERKLDEPGLAAWAAGAGLPLRGFPPETLSGVPVPTPSEVVRAAVGTPSVAEAAACLSAGADRPWTAELAGPKGVYGRVTVAVARRRARAGQIAIVGLGPGDPAQMTPAAERALAAAEVVVGYSGYLAQLGSRPAGQRVLGYGLGEERQRCEQAVALAAQGYRAALVGSGDAGVYGMASLTFEVLQERGWDGRWPEVRVLPGITAATAAAALLGAPLGHDFAAISLSDLHTPWATIALRLRAAADADLVVALYNPRSGRRAGHLAAASALLSERRAPATPVGVVRNAFRPDASVMVTTLGELAQAEVDMFTIVLVGNSQTRLVAGHMVTPRGYPQGGGR